MGQITQATQQMQQAQNGLETFRKLIADQLPAMRHLLQDRKAAARLAQIALECYRKNPNLGECTPDSIRACLIQCAAVGLEPSDVDGMGNVYLIPRGDQCTFELGYRGMLVLLRRSGLYDSIVARAVHEGDQFEYTLGTNESITHVPCDNPGMLTHVYLVAYLKGSNRPCIHILNRKEVEDRRKQSKMGNRGAWLHHYDAMAIKSVIRDAFKVLPKSTEMERAFNNDEAVPVPVVYEVPEAPVDVDPVDVDPAALQGASE